MELIHKEESYKIIGLCYELIKSKIPFEREKEYAVNYKGIILPHKFYSDYKRIVL